MSPHFGRDRSRRRQYKNKSELVVDKGVKNASVVIKGGCADASVTGIAESTGVPVNLYLLQDDLDRLRPFFDNAVDGFAAIPEFELIEVLSRTNSSENPGTLLIHNNPVRRIAPSKAPRKMRPPSYR